MNLDNQWLSFQIHMDSADADNLIGNALTYFSNIFKNEDLIEKWFFIRYPTPNFHLRVRFLMTDMSKKDELGFIFTNGVKEEVACKIEQNIYEPEFGRYGEETMHLVEDIFYHDSQMICSLIDVLEDDEEGHIRWYFAFRIVQSYLECFGLDKEEQARIFKQGAEYFKQEFGVDDRIEEQYELEKENLDAILTFTRESMPELEVLLDILDDFTLAVQPVCQQIASAEQKNSPDLDRLIRSLIHLSINRLFEENQRHWESGIYNFFLLRDQKIA